MNLPRWLTLVARLCLGGLLIYSGVAKTQDPAGFLKLLRTYELTSHPFVLNLIAATLPWFETFCGLLLLTGIALRGTALVSLLMLVPFTSVVLMRALAIQARDGVSFCAIRFDCGCGTGEVGICHKLVENGLLMAAALLLLFTRETALAIRARLFPAPSPPPQPSDAPPPR